MYLCAVGGSWCCSCCATGIEEQSSTEPLKRLSTARLELCACVLAAHLHNRIQRVIDMRIDGLWFWTDSSICLNWLKLPPNTWKTFVANSVSEIQHFTAGCKWKHVAGIENPADLVSRGMSVADFNESRSWKRGPSWLALSEKFWPVSDPSEGDDEERALKVLQTSIHTAPTYNWVFLRWSSYTRLVNVVALCLRFALYSIGHNDRTLVFSTQHAPVGTCLCVAG